jgi:hypothetical protein
MLRQLPVLDPHEAGSVHCLPSRRATDRRPRRPRVADPRPLRLVRTVGAYEDPAMRSTATETLRKRQQCHDMKAEGATHRQIQAVINVGRATVRDWLSRPRPTDEEVAELPVNKTDCTGQVGFKARFDPELFARLRAEAELQGAATNRIIGCAVRLYLDCLSRARAGGQDPIDIMGYRC